MILDMTGRFDEIWDRKTNGFCILNKSLVFLSLRKSWNYSQPVKYHCLQLFIRRGCRGRSRASLGEEASKMFHYCWASFFFAHTSWNLVEKSRTEYCDHTWRDNDLYQRKPMFFEFLSIVETCFCFPKLFYFTEFPFVCIIHIFQCHALRMYKLWRIRRTRVLFIAKFF